MTNQDAIMKAGLLPSLTARERIASRKIWDVSTPSFRCSAPKIFWSSGVGRILIFTAGFVLTAFPMCGTVWQRLPSCQQENSCRNDAGFTRFALRFPIFAHACTGAAGVLWISL